jgi:hypothetical protein
MMGNVPVTAGCTWATSVELDATHWGDTDTGTKNCNTTQWFAGRVSIAATSTITGYIIRGYDDSSDAATLYVELWTGDATDPTDTSAAGLIAGTTFTLATPANSIYDLDCTLTTPKAALAAGTYWIVARASAAQWRESYDVDVAGERYCRSTDGGATWGTCTDNGSLRMKLIGCVD